MTDDVFFEPILNQDNKPCWLKRTYENISTTKPNKNVKKTIKDNKPLEKTPVFELLPEGLWQCQKCMAIIEFAEGKPAYCTGCDRNSDFKPTTDIINPDLWKLPYWTDMENLDLTAMFIDSLALVKKCIVFVEEIQYKIYLLWIISSYKSESFESIGFPMFIGLIDSGKSRALDLIREIGYRMVHCASISFPAMVRCTHFFGAGILLDEAQNKLNTRTETGQQYLDFIKPSYRRGSKYTVADKEDQKKTISYNNYGFKAFAGERGFDRAMTSRGIKFEMEQDYPEIERLSDIQQELNDMQTTFLNYKYKTDPPPELPIDIGIKGRIREVFESVIRTAMHLGIEYDDIVEYAQARKKEQQEELSNSEEWEILNVIKSNEENEKLFDAPEEISFVEILEKMGREYNPKAAQHLGYVFRKKLQLNTKRRNNGTVLLLTDPKNARKLKYLYRRYKL